MIQLKGLFKMSKPRSKFQHMAFNGLESFPDANDLIPQMQRLGIAFGAHANAYTSFDET